MKVRGCVGGVTNIGRLRSIYDRYLQMTDPAMLRERPYWIYSTVNDSRTSPEHQAWDNLVLRYDDPWWHTHFPPNSAGCRCMVRSARPVDLERKGLSVGTAPNDGTYETIDPVTGRQAIMPNGIAPGWNVSPANLEAWSAFIAWRRAVKQGTSGA